MTDMLPSSNLSLLVPMFMDMNGWPEARAVRTYGFLMMGFSLVSTIMFVVTARLANRSGFDVRGAVLGAGGHGGCIGTQDGTEWDCEVRAGCEMGQQG